MILLLSSPLTLFAPLLWALLFLLVFCLIYWGVNKILAAFGVGDPIRTVVIVALVIIGVLALVYYLAGSYGYIH